MAERGGEFFLVDGPQRASQERQHPITGPASFVEPAGVAADLVAASSQLTATSIPAPIFWSSSARSSRLFGRAVPGPVLYGMHRYRMTPSTLRALSVAGLCYCGVSIHMPNPVPLSVFTPYVPPLAVSWPCKLAMSEQIHSSANTPSTIR